MTPKHDKLTKKNEQEITQNPIREDGEGGNRPGFNQRQLTTKNWGPS